jgi:fucose 4-O-acetylase-like acetyltransferase
MPGHGMTDFKAERLGHYSDRGDDRAAMESRLRHIDVAKGIGMLLVVFGHSPPLLDDRSTLFEVVFSFHVPLFFFLSGVFFKPERPFTDVVRTRAAALLRPFYFTLLVLSIDDLLIDRESEVIPYLVGMGYGNGSAIRWIPMWFLPHLFGVSVLVWAVCRATRIDSQRPWLRGVLVATMLAAGAFTVQSFWWPVVTTGSVKILGLPYSMDVGLISGAFFLAGYLLRDRIVALEWKPAYAAIALAAFAAVHVAFDHTIDLNLRRYDSVVFSTITAAAGVYLVLAASTIVARSDRLVRPLAYVGTASVFLLIFHSFPQEKVFHQLDRRLPELKWVSAMVALGFAVLVPIALYEIVKRVPVLASVYLPKQKTPVAQAAAPDAATT